MKADEDILDFLIRGENIEMVLDIGQRIEDIKNRLLKNFWERIYANINTRLTESAGDKWICQLDNPLVKDGGIIVKSSPSNNLIPQLEIVMLDEAKNKPIFFALKWNRSVVTEPEAIIEIQQLRDKAQQLKFLGLEELDPSYPAGWEYTPWILGSNKSLVRIAKETESRSEYVDEVTDYFLKQYEKFRALVDEANEKLLHKNYQ